jgi:uncharacterized Zn finger protein
MSFPYGKTIRVEGGLRAQSERGRIGESWWSKRFLAVLESFALGSRLTRGRSYARAGQVLSLDITPGLVRATVQGSRPKPYDVSIKLAALNDKVWSAVEAALAEQAIFTARLLAGEMPAEIEEVFAAAGAPLFPTSIRQLTMSCSCPDSMVPCKHIAATFYLLAEAFDADPFQILRWRGRDREALLAPLRTSRPSLLAGPPPAVTGSLSALADLASPELSEMLDRFWVSPVPLPARPPTLDTDVDLLLRQLPSPPGSIGGAELAQRLRALYAALASPSHTTP